MVTAVICAYGLPSESNLFDRIRMIYVLGRRAAGGCGPTFLIRPFSTQSLRIRTQCQGTMDELQAARCRYWIGRTATNCVRTFVLHALLRSCWPPTQRWPILFQGGAGEKMHCSCSIGLERSCAENGWRQYPSSLHICVSEIS